MHVLEVVREIQGVVLPNDERLCRYLLVDVRKSIVHLESKCNSLTHNRVQGVFSDDGDG